MHLLTALRAHRLVAVVRGDDPRACLHTVLTLAEEGVPLIEVSLSGADAPTVLAEARAALGPSAPLGAGTVVTVDDARLAADHGADFVVTPGLGAGFDEARRIGLPVLAGALSPTEVIAATERGADAVKLFPAGPLGGPAYLAALRAPFPTVPLVPVGGVDAAAARAYLAGGATAVGVGSPLVGDAGDGGDLDALRGRAREFLRVVAGAR